MTLSDQLERCLAARRPRPGSSRCCPYSSPRWSASGSGFCSATLSTERNLPPRSTPVAVSSTSGTPHEPPGRCFLFAGGDPCDPKSVVGRIPGRGSSPGMNRCRSSSHSSWARFPFPGSNHRLPGDGTGARDRHAPRPVEVGHPDAGRHRRSRGAAVDETFDHRDEPRSVQWGPCSRCSGSAS